MKKITKTFNKIAWLLVRGYQLFISPIFYSFAGGGRCRFYPTCSRYCRVAIERHGAVKGSWLGIKRLAKCSPLHEGGVDLVPEKLVPEKLVSEKLVETHSFPELVIPVKTGIQCFNKDCCVATNYPLNKKK